MAALTVSQKASESSVAVDRASLAAEFDRLLGDHIETVERSRALLQPAAALAEAAISVLRAGGKLLLCGNGGSAADSQHIATELTIRFERDRRALAAIALTTDTSALTAAGNDFGFERIFSRQIEALARPGDLLIAFTTSGESPNIVAALIAAKEMGVRTACFTGRHGGRISREKLAEHCLIVPSDKTNRVQEVHILLGHLVCAAIDAAFADG
jgi:D-sedoheptulose 7-phosphate isomerase